jgi:hypothetical protein
VEQPPLAIDSLDWEWKKHPVIRIDLNPGNYAEGVDVLKAVLRNILSNVADNAGLVLRGELLPDQFGNLIQDMNRVFGQKAVVIIDEYDKPLLTTIDRPDTHKKIREELKAFYGVLKSQDASLQLVFLTGVTKFSHVSVFSDLNNLTDISMNPRFYDICGITQEELERNLAAEITTVYEKKHSNRQDYLFELKRFYNGYRFSENSETVYNPFGLLNHFNEEGKFNAYWFATGTPAFLITLIDKQKIDILKLEKKKINSFDFQRFDVENMDAVPVLYQSGYLTIIAYDETLDEYTLDYPNEEVRGSFAKALLDHYIGKAEDGNKLVVSSIPKALRCGDIDAAMHSLMSFFAAIPYGIQLKNEKYYQTVIFLVFRMLGLYCQSEVQTADGRIDCVVETANHVYCFEFKLDGSVEEALKQIDRKNYLFPWRNSGKQLCKVGVVFDHEKRNIGEWKAIIAREST